MYSDFAHVIAAEGARDLTGFGSGTNFEKFRTKARAFPRAHQDHITIHKLRMNQPLTRTDLAEVERVLAESGVAQTLGARKRRRPGWA